MTVQRLTQIEVAMWRMVNNTDRHPFQSATDWTPAARDALVLEFEAWARLQRMNATPHARRCYDWNNRLRAAATRAKRATRYPSR